LKTSFIFALTLALAAFAGCQSEPPRSAERPAVKLALNWFPEAEHGGYYAAQVHEYYKGHDLEVQILGGGPNAPVIKLVATGKVEFGVTNADDVLIARSQGAPVVALMAPYQVNPRCIMVHAESGIDRIEDIRNMTLALSQRPAFSHYLRKIYPFENVRIVPYPGNVVQFLSNPDFAQQAYVFSEPFVARKHGADPKTLLVADVGFNPYASVLITAESTLEKSTEVARKMTAASVAGWRHYLQAPARANQEINKLNPEMDVEILGFGASESLPLIAGDVARSGGVGAMSLERWETLARQLEEADLIEPGSVDPQAAFTTRFLSP
jgi:NitT/TauT family transport system substrate-binding protein